jgi:hypothetical protein
MRVGPCGIPLTYKRRAMPLYSKGWTKRQKKMTRDNKEEGRIDSQILLASSFALEKLA